MGVDAQSQPIQLRLDDEVIDTALIQGDGTAAFSLPDVVDLNEQSLVVESDIGTYALSSEEIQVGLVTLHVGQRMGPPRALTANLDEHNNGNLDEPLSPPTYPGRLRPPQSSPSFAPVAGTPSPSPFPTSGVPERYSARYLSVEGQLCDDGGHLVVGKGLLTEYEVTWEPLGWALDEWIETQSLAPGEDVAASGLAVSRSVDGRSTTSSIDAEDTAISEVGGAGSQEVMDLVSSSDLSRQGFTAGFGRTQANSLGITVNPVAALTNAVTGSVQLGYSNGSAQAEARQRATAQKRLYQSLERTTGDLRRRNAESLIGQLTALRDDRRLRAMRNLNRDTSLNLALYSVCRQWLVTTVVASKRPVAFVPIHQIAVDFVEEDVFLHRGVLSSTLLDEALREPLERVAGRFAVLDAAPTTDQPTGAVVRRVSGSITFSDEANGQGSSVRLDVRFRSDSSSDSQAGFTFVDTTPQVSTHFTIDVDDQPLSRFTGVALQFVNPGGVLDTRAAISELTMDAELADTTTVPLWRASEEIVLTANTERVLGRGPTPSSSRQREAVGHPDHQSELNRVLAHLNAHRAFYRLALDLARDSVTRFSQLCQDERASIVSSDLDPVGVAGAHLAFVTEEEQPAEHDPAEQVFFQQYLSTPAGGTFLEAIPGSIGAHASKCLGTPPTIPTATNTDYPWPAAVELKEFPTTAPAAAEPASPPAGTPPTIPPSELVSKLDPSTVLTALSDLLKAGETEAATKMAAALDAAQKAADAAKAPTGEEKEKEKEKEPGAVGAGTPAAGTAATPAEKPDEPE